LDPITHLGSNNGRFTLEASEALNVQGERIRQDLQCDIAIQLRIARTVHRPDSTCTE